MKLGISGGLTVNCGKCARWGLSLQQCPQQCCVPRWSPAFRGNVKSHKAACLPFEAEQDSFLGQASLMAKQSCAAWALKKTKNVLPYQAIHLLSDIKVCIKIGIPGICSGLKEKVQLHRRTVLGSWPSVTSLSEVLLRRQPQNPFWSHVPVQPPHQTPTPPVKQFPSTVAHLSDAPLLVLASNATPRGLRWLQDYCSSHT